jgi:hypothetical protein
MIFAVVPVWFMALLLMSYSACPGHFQIRPVRAFRSARFPDSLIFNYGRGQAVFSAFGRLSLLLAIYPLYGSIARIHADGASSL